MTLLRLCSRPDAPLDGALPFATVQQQVAAVIRGKVIVGHSLWMDLSGAFDYSRASPHAHLPAQCSASHILLSTRATSGYISPSATRCRLRSSQGSPHSPGASCGGASRTTASSAP